MSMKDQADTLRLQIDISEIDRIRQENARLRERVSELERGIEAATSINNEHQEREQGLRERVAELEQSLGCWKDSHRLALESLKRCEKRERLMLDAVRLAAYGELTNDLQYLKAVMKSILRAYERTSSAPLIAEAQQKEDAHE
jgi:FtsZ-binding cell division protein ZapB